MDNVTSHRVSTFADCVGVVVIGRNEGNRLINCLMSINPHSISTVYVDSGSTDGSDAAAESLGATVVRLDPKQPFTAARGRNEGFYAIKNLKRDIQFVQFVDGDCALSADWLKTAVEFIRQHDDVAVVCGRRREQHPERSIYNWLCDVEWDTPVGEALACGGDFLVCTKAFDAVHGFQPQLIAGEEPELCLRLREAGWKVFRIRAEMTRHDAAIARFHQWWRRTVRSGYAYADVFQRHAGSPSAIWKRQIVRAVIWGGFAPIAILISALIKPILLLLGLIYPIQISRIALCRGVTNPRSWIYALFMTIAKFAEFEGILKYVWARQLGKACALIEYK